jgi:hypothetical protein
VRRDGRTLIQTRLYFNDKGRVKLELSLAKGRTPVGRAASVRMRLARPGGGYVKINHANIRHIDAAARRIG